MAKLNEEVAEASNSYLQDQEAVKLSIARQGLIDRVGFDPFVPTEAPEEKAVDVIPTAQDPFKAVRTALTESPITQTAAGIRDMVASTIDIPTDLINLFREVEIRGVSDFIPEIDRSDSTTLNIVRSASQFISQFAPIFSALKGAKIVTGIAKKAPKVAQAVRGEIAGAIAGFSAFDPDDPNLSNLINDMVPILRNPVSEFLATSPDDKAAFNRFRNTVEGLGLGALTEGFIGAFRAIRNARGLKGLADEAKVDIKEKVGLPAERISDEALVQKLIDAQDKISKLIKKEGFGPIEGTPAMRKAVAIRQRVFNEVFNAKHPEKPIGTTVIFEGQEMALTKAEFDMTQSVDSLRKGFAGGRDFKETLTLKPKEGEASFINFEEFDKLKVVKAGKEVTEESQAKANFNKFFDRIARKVKSERQGQEILDDLAEEGISPKQVSKDFWSNTFTKLDTKQQKTITDHVFDLTSFKPGDTIGFEASGKKIIAKDWEDIATQIIELGDNIEELEGVERGLVSLMEFANRNVKGIKEITEEIPTIDFSKVDNIEGFNEAVEKSRNLIRERIKAKRGKRPIPTSQKAADLIGMTPDDVKNIPEGTAFNAENIIAAGDVVRGLLDEAETLAAKVFNGNATKAEIAAFMDATQNVSLIDPKLFGVRGESGRSLQALTVVKPTIDRLEQITQGLAGRKGGEVNIEQFAGMFLQLMKETTPTQVAKWLRVIRRIPGMITELFLSSLLSGIKTHEINFLGNLSLLFMAPLERGVAARLPMSTVVKGESTYMMFGMLNAWSKAIRLAGRTLKSGVAADEGIKRSTKLEGFSTRKITAEAFELTNDSLTGRAINGFGSIATFPLRALMASDVFFKVLNKSAEIHALAIREATEQGLRGNEAGKFIREFVADPDFKFVKKAEDFAAYQTFTNDVGKFGTAVQNFANSHMFVKFFLPFVRTPINIFKYSYERTPIGGIHASLKQIISGADPVARDLALTRLAMSSAAAGVFASMTAAGMITGGGPANKEMRKIMRENGWQPNSFRVGDTFVSYSRADPIGQMVGDVADFVEASQYLNYTGSEGMINQIEAVALGIVMAYSKNMLSKTYVTGMQTALDIAQVGATTGSLGKSFAEAKAGGRKFVLAFMPTIAKDIARSMDNTLREADTYSKAWKAVTPYYSQEGFAERNIFGEVIIRGTSIANNVEGKSRLTDAFVTFINPLYITHDKNDIVMEELIKREAIMQQLPNWIGGTKPKFSFEVPKVGEGIKLTDEQQDFWKIEAGRGLRKDILKVINSSTYRFRFSDFEKQQELLAIQTEHRQEAKDKMIKRFKLRGLLEQKEEELDKAKQVISELINR